jgi:hypothetical protein
LNTREETPNVACPVENCTGRARDHESEIPQQNLHTQPGEEWPLASSVDWPLEVELTMDETSWPYWRLNVEVPHTGEDLTAIQVGYIAAELNLNALHVAELNRTIEGDR